MPTSFTQDNFGTTDRFEDLIHNSLLSLPEQDPGRLKPSISANIKRSGNHPIPTFQRKESDGRSSPSVTRQAERSSKEVSDSTTTNNRMNFDTTVNSSSYGLCSRSSPSSLDPTPRHDPQFSSGHVQLSSLTSKGNVRYNGQSAPPHHSLPNVPVSVDSTRLRKGHNSQVSFQEPLPAYGNGGSPNTSKASTTSSASKASTAEYDTKSDSPFNSNLEEGKDDSIFPWSDPRLIMKAHPARHPKVDFSPALSPDAQWLLLTTPPPPPSSLRVDIERISIRSGNFTASDEKISTPVQDDEKDKGFVRKSLAALGLLGTSHFKTNFVKDGLIGSSVGGKAGADSGNAAKSIGDRTTGGSQSKSIGREGAGRLGKKSKNLLDSTSEALEIPRSWEEYGQRYANGDIDVDDPPFPPLHSKVALYPHNVTQTTALSPFEEGNYRAPLATNESYRQAVLMKLNLFSPLIPGNTQAGYGSPFAQIPLAQFGTDDSTLGTTGSISRDTSGYRSRQGSLSSDWGSSMYTTSPSTSISHHASPSIKSHVYSGQQLHSSVTPLQNHPVMQSILSRCATLLSTPIVMISILFQQHQIFLCSTGMPEGVENLPREQTFCSHTVLNGPRGLVVNDTGKDWRFKESMLSVVLRARFYAGMPIYAPKAFDSSEAGRVAIGTLAIIDTIPRNFSSTARSQLRTMAEEVTFEIDSWLQDRHFAILHINSPVTSLQDLNSSATIPRSSFDTRYVHWQTQNSVNDNPESPKIGQKNSTSSNGASSKARGSPLRHSSNRGFSSFDHRSPAFDQSSPETDQRGDLRRGSVPNVSRGRSDSNSSMTGRSEREVVTMSHNKLPTMEEEGLRSGSLSSPSSKSPEKRSTNSLSSWREDKERNKKSTETAVTAAESKIPVRAEYIYGRERSSEGPTHNPSKASSPSKLLKPSPNLTFVSKAIKSPPRTTSQKIIDAMTSSLCINQKLALVYLVSMDLSDSKPATPLKLLSAYNLPLNKPTFDPILHLKALRAPEGGLLYRNPEAKRSVEDQGKSHKEGSAGSGYASGILLPVAESENTGWILGGYTKDSNREFVKEDLDSFLSVAEQLGKLMKSQKD